MKKLSEFGESCLGQLVLQVEDILPRPVITLGPEMGSIGWIDKPEYQPDPATLTADSQLPVTSR